MNTKANQIILAPMEGVIDALMRDLLTSINNFDLCVTEFIRVVDSILPKHVYFKSCPELHNKGLTRSNTPVRIQLLGQHPSWMAENAVRAIELGSHGVDVNFGCPAKTVNKSKGGAVLLKSPEDIYQIVKTMKESIGSENVLSVKIRLGFDDVSLLDEIVDAVVQAQANLLTIHARTKQQGYKPPAYWNYIGETSKKYNIPLVANGDIWSKNDAINCIKQANTNNLMLGRGILALPNLVGVIKNDDCPMSWLNICHFLITYSHLEAYEDDSFYFSSRLKQWLKYLKINYVEANILFEQIKPLKNKKDILKIIEQLIS